MTAENLEHDHFEVVRRMMLAFRSIGWSERGRLVVLSMYSDPAPWTVQKLSYATTYSRASVREVLHRGAKIGIIEETPDGWITTERGRELVRAAYADAYKIGIGKTRGWSEAYQAAEKKVIDWMEANGRVLPKRKRDPHWRI